MKRILSTLLLFLSCNLLFSQVHFDTSKVKVSEIKRYKKQYKPNEVYLEMYYGGYEIINKTEVLKLRNRIIQDIQCIYSDYPAGSDHTELNNKRLASLYLVLPEAYNKPWITWKFVKQTDCKSEEEAAKMYHGFVITFKEGPIPNEETPIPYHIQQKLKKIDVNVELDTAVTPEALVNFLSSHEVKISNMKIRNRRGLGLFRERKKTVGLFNGVLLTTGSVRNAVGPNNTPSRTSVIGYGVSNEDTLENLTNGSGFLFDACALEFDLEVAADSFVFNYVFASEEYPEYLQYNDAFALLITGEGLNGLPDTTLNLAYLPDKKVPVTVSNINHLVNSENYIENNWDNSLELFKAWQYDGFTKVMTARVKVVPNRKYKVKLLIADFGDPYYDSGVFIQSFGTRTKK